MGAALVVPETDNKHPFNTFPFPQNFECPWGRDRIAAFQKRIDKIAGLGSNGRSNVRLMWPADTDPSISMQEVGGELRARYRLWTDEYKCSRTSPDSGIEIIEYVKVDIVPPRFILEEFHEPAELEFNPDLTRSGDGYYTHLLTVAQHDEKCCDGREAAKGKLCLGLYREPGDRDLEELQRRIQLRDAAAAGHRAGERVSEAEFAEDLQAYREWQDRYNTTLENNFREAAANALAVNGWRLFNHDAGKRSRYHVLGGK